MKISTFFFILLNFSSVTFACECNQTKGLGQEIKARDYVFLGRILSVDSIMIVDSAEMNIQNRIPKIVREGNMTNFPVAHYSIEVRTIFKGKFDTDTIELFSRIGTAYCGLKLKTGSEYIIYGNNLPEAITDHLTIFPQGKKIVWLHRCNRTRVKNKDEIVSLKNYFK